MMRFARVTIRRTGRGRTLYLRVLGETDKVLVGFEVDKHGEEVSGATFDQRKHIIHKDAIARLTEMVMSPTYATLEEVAPEPAKPMCECCPGIICLKEAKR